MQRRTFLQAGLGAAGIGACLRATRARTQSFAPLGSVDVPGATEAVVHHGGDVAYVANKDGFTVVDITAPSSPQVLADRREITTGEDTPLSMVYDVWPSGDRLAVGGPAFYRPTQPSGFALFDISEPADPQQLTFHPTEHHIHNLSFEGDIVYLTGSGTERYPLVMVDVSGDTPQEVGRWSLLDEEGFDPVPSQSYTLHDVSVHDGVAYLPYWDSGTWLVDVSDPSAPETLSWAGDFTVSELQEMTFGEAGVQREIPPGNHHFTQVNQDGSILVVGIEAWAFEDITGEIGDSGERIGGAGGIVLYDVSDKTDPQRLATIEPPESFDQTREGWFTTAHNCDIVGDRLYSSWYYGGVKVHDISDPTEPVELTWWRDPRETAFWTARSVEPGETFVASSIDAGTFFSTPNETQERLYVFPDRSGSQSDPPDLTSWPRDVYGDPPDDWEGGPDGSTSSDGNAPSDDDADADTADENETTEADGSGPGFGVGGALAALGGGYLLGRRFQRGG